MTTLLKISTSILSSGNANRLADDFVARWQRNHPRGRVIERDLSHDPGPHLGETALTGFSTPVVQLRHSVAASSRSTCASCSVSSA